MKQSISLVSRQWGGGPYAVSQRGATGVTRRLRAIFMMRAALLGTHGGERLGSGNQATRLACMYVRAHACPPAAAGERAASHCRQPVFSPTKWEKHFAAAAARRARSQLVLRLAVGAEVVLVFVVAHRQIGHVIALALALLLLALRLRLRLVLLLLLRDGTGSRKGGLSGNVGRGRVGAGRRQGKRPGAGKS